MQFVRVSLRSLADMQLNPTSSGTILGLKPEQAKNAVSNTARLTVLRGHSNRQTYRGVLGNPEVKVVTTSTTNEQEKAAAGEKRKRPVDE